MRNEILYAAKETVGTPYHPMGRLSGSGLDCIGVIAVCCKAINAGCKDCPNYSEDPGQDILEKYLDLNFDKIDPKDAQPGDILLFWIRRENEAQHVAIKSDLGIIHTHKGSGRVVEHRIDDRWEKRIMGAYSFRDVSDFTKIEQPKPIVRTSPKRSSCCGGKR